jgi:hypothetical protein
MNEARAIENLNYIVSLIVIEVGEHNFQRIAVECCGKFGLGILDGDVVFLKYGLNQVLNCEPCAALRVHAFLCLNLIALIAKLKSLGLHDHFLQIIGFSLQHSCY